MKKTLFIIILVAIILAGCSSEAQTESYNTTEALADTVSVNRWLFKGVPEGATLMDCKFNKLLFLEKDREKEVEQLWIYELETQKASAFLTCHHHYGPTCYSGRNGYAWPRDSICNVCSAKFVRCPEDVVVVGESCATYAIYFVVSDSDALYLTGGTKYLGELYENGWYAIEERSYEEEYDPYSIVSYYDENGKLMRTDRCRKGGKRYKTTEE